MLLTGWMIVVGAASSVGPVPLCRADTYAQLLKVEAATLDASARDRVDALSRIYVASRKASRAVGCRNMGRVIEDQFKAAALFANYVPDAEPLRNALVQYELLIERGTAGPEHHRRLIGLHVARGDFTEAERLRRRWLSSLPALPRVIPGRFPPGLPVYAVHADGSLVRDSIRPNGDQVVAIVHPRCGHSRRALQSIVAQPAYQDLRAKLILVVPSGPYWAGDGIAEWNQLHPGLPMRVMYADKRWADFDRQQTPVFHLVREGRVIETGTGWRGTGEEVAPIMRALRRVRD
ncbi:hypothetical protein [Stenotrophomonas sp.]|uniref:hypothetical protein n=1 Tax=Stenotrophomonas sp. TaxID=69392 RepID=UPI0028ABDA47|nr:hypothetical protein [Stenotrophomonas sp.]